MNLAFLFAAGVGLALLWAWIGESLEAARPPADDDAREREAKRVREREEAARLERESIAGSPPPMPERRIRNVPINHPDRRRASNV